MQQRTPSPLILSVETATETRSIALCRGFQPILVRAGGAERDHSSRVLGEIDELLRAAGVRLKEVDLFAVACGPGSFTGLRSGLATVKAFAATLGRTAAGIPTLHAVAHAAGPAARVVAALPAGRGELFVQFLRVSEDGAMVEELNAPAYLSPPALLERAAAVGGPLRWAGSGAWKIATELESWAARLGVEWSVESDDGPVVGGARRWSLAAPVKAYAGSVAALGRRRYLAGEELGADELHALYVRPSDAEIKEQCLVPNE
ncbi:MAG: tRNA (adenosine(37)-N6)-threonylcarbamoyltransferase complex dimerization subunit type 1 TsaB [Pyrinomonadaceae bacterium]